MSINAAINAYPYLTAGYNGLDCDLGLSVGWNVVDDTPRLSLASFDNEGNMQPKAPAFQSSTGTNRVRRFAIGLDWFSTEAEIETVRPVDNAHGTTCSSIAMGSLRNGQDPAVSTPAGREARSGLAGGAVGYWCAMGGVQSFESCLAWISDTGMIDVSEDWAVNGVDVLTSSAGTVYEGWCPSEQQARGVDSTSEAVTDAYFEKSLPTVKSAGNMHADGCVWETNAPAASPVALPVGALSNDASTAYAAQRRQHLNATSSGDRTGDGRVFPLLVVPHQACGAAIGDAGPWGDKRYIDQGATSGATPRVAGAMLLFKHWYLEAHGTDSGNSPGRLICNVLNFADGVAYANHDGTGGRVATPAPHFGLGRMRMRLYEPGHMGGHYCRSTKVASLRTGDVEEFDLSGPNRSRILAGAKRLRITLWWAEVNTDEGEDRAVFTVRLFDAATDETIATTTERRPPLRFNFECDDSLFPPVPTVDLWLSITGDSVPREERHLLRDYRSVVASWFWETGPDLSMITCTPGENDCPEQAPMSVVDAPRSNTVVDAEQQGNGDEAAAPEGDGLLMPRDDAEDDEDLRGDEPGEADAAANAEGDQASGAGARVRRGDLHPPVAALIEARWARVRACCS